MYYGGKQREGEKHEKIIGFGTGFLFRLGDANVSSRRSTGRAVYLWRGPLSGASPASTAPANPNLRLTPLCIRTFWGALELLTMLLKSGLLLDSIV